MKNLIQRHSGKVTWPSVILAIAYLVYQGWSDREASKNRNQAVWQAIHEMNNRIKEQDDEISFLQADLNYFEGALHIQYHGTVDKRPTRKDKTNE